MTSDAAGDLPTAPPPDADAPAFEAVDSHEALLAWSRAYGRRAVAATDLAVDLALVDWDVSTRAKRRAAAVLHPRLEDTTLSEPVDWTTRTDDANAAGGGSPSSTPGDAPAESAGDAPATSHAPGETPADGGAGTGTSTGEPTADEVETSTGAATNPPRCTVRLTWDAASAYDRETWAETLRHELVHVEQFQRYGTTGHGPSFERRARELSTTVRCQRFATPKYVLTCPACETVVARRYRDCKLVRRHEEYRSSCCEAPLALTRTGAAD